MRRVKKISISKYITIYMLLILFLVSFVMLCFINFFASKAIEYDIRTDMSREIRKNRNFLDIVDGKPVAQELFRFENDNMYFQVVDAQGKLLLGDYPDGIELQKAPGGGDVKSVKIGNVTYLLLDLLTLDENRKKAERTYVRCVVRKKEMSSQYEAIRYSSYLSIPIMCLLVLLGRILITRQLVNPLKEMSRTAEKIGKQEQLTERVEYQGNILELESMVNANNRMLDRLENMIDIQKQFTSDVAHELRTPVAVIMAQCEYLSGSNPDIAAYKEAIEVIYRQEEKAKDIIFQLLNLSRLDQDRVSLDYEYADLVEIVQVVCEEELMREDKKIDFIISGTDVFATIDVSLLTLAMQNLVGNAVKYSKEPIRVEITLENRATSEEGCEEAVIAVRDYGCGMDEEQRRNIFNRFYRGEHARNSEGFGLGLALVWKIAEVHRGKVLVESKAGEGSTFTLILPKERK